MQKWKRQAWTPKFLTGEVCVDVESSLYRVPGTVDRSKYRYDEAGEDDTPTILARGY
jgi:hypothetical protein